MGWGGRVTGWGGVRMARTVRQREGSRLSLSRALFPSPLPAPLARRGGRMPRSLTARATGPSLPTPVGRGEIRLRWVHLTKRRRVQVGLGSAADGAGNRTYVASARGRVGQAPSTRRPHGKRHERHQSSSVPPGIPPSLVAHPPRHPSQVGVAGQVEFDRGRARGEGGWVGGGGGSGGCGVGGDRVVARARAGVGCNVRQAAPRAFAAPGVRVEV